MSAIAALVCWPRSSRTENRANFPRGNNFLRIEDTNNVWRANRPQRLMHYARHFGQSYSCSSSGTLPLTNVLAIYSRFAAAAVYVSEDIAGASVAPFGASAHTHETLVWSLNKVLRTNGFAIVERSGNLLCVSQRGVK